MSADPLRLFEDAGLPERLRQDLAQARDAEAGYDTEGGLARFSALIALAPASGVVASAVEAAAPHAAAGAAASATEAATAAHAAASSAAAAGAVTSATAGTVLGAMGAKVAVGVAVLGIAVGAATFGSAGNDARAPAPVSARIAPPARAAVEASRQQLARVAAEADAATSPEVTTATDVRPAQPGMSPSAPSSAPASSATRLLEEETEHLAALREAAPSDPARAVRMAEEGARRFPRGVFAQEREVIAIRALAASGRGGEARVRAAAFRARHPESPAAEGLRRIAGEAPTGDLGR
jgi:hypothetical protein